MDQSQQAYKDLTSENVCETSRLSPSQNGLERSAESFEMIPDSSDSRRDPSILMRHSTSLLLPSVKMNSEKGQKRSWYPRNFPFVKEQLFDRNRLKHLKLNRQFKKYH